MYHFPFVRRQAVVSTHIYPTTDGTVFSTSFAATPVARFYSVIRLFFRINHEECNHLQKQVGVMETLHIEFARLSQRKTKMLKCPTCERRRKFLCEFQEWYGWLTTCLTCGEQWEDGERLPRPFAPGWRKERIEQARLRMGNVL